VLALLELTTNPQTPEGVVGSVGKLLRTGRGDECTRTGKGVNVGVVRNQRFIDSSAVQCDGDGRCITRNTIFLEIAEGERMHGGIGTR